VKNSIEFEILSLGYHSLTHSINKFEQIIRTEKLFIDLEPPNEIAQRQLLLIAKVLQNLANMTTNKKEPFMSNMEEFVKRNTPKIRQFYRNLLVKIQSNIILK
jgi:hypothetical protein